MNQRRLIDALYESEKKTYKVGIDVQHKISNQSILDARVGTFYNLAQVIRSSKTYLILQDEYLNDRQWYVDIYLQKWGQQWPPGPVRGSRDIILHNDHELLNRDFNQVILVGYTQTLFSIIDSGFRLFRVALDSTACDNGTACFFKIYNWLLDEIDRKQQYQNFMKFFSYMRNTIHNNGRYMNKKSPKEDISYRGQAYHFENGKPVSYPNPYELLFLEITADVVDMMEDIILNTQILQIPSVPDPMA
jgi:hypothetical protein